MIQLKLEEPVVKVEMVIICFKQKILNIVCSFHTNFFFHHNLYKTELLIFNHICFISKEWTRHRDIQNSAWIWRRKHRRILLDGKKPDRKCWVIERADCHRVEGQRGQQCWHAVVRNSSRRSLPRSDWESEEILLGVESVHNYGSPNGLQRSPHLSILHRFTFFLIILFCIANWTFRAYKRV